MFTKEGSCGRVFHEVYERRRSSKQILADQLGLSLPTVTAALRALEREGLVVRKGTYASTGGRPAVAYEFVPDARFAVGVELVAEQARLAAVDLYGAVLAQHVEPLAFERSDAYFARVAELVEEMVEYLSGPQKSLLGVTVAIQGIVDDAGRVTFGGLLGADDVQVSVDDFTRHLMVAPQFVHDAEAAAYAELWRHRELANFAYLSLNDHLGSALVLDGKLLHGGPLGAGVAEHMVLQPGGARCYCGGAGCAETVLGAQALARRAGMPLERFFASARAGEAGPARLWDGYLSDLALLIHNVRMVTCADVVIGGRLARFMTEADLRAVRMRAAGHGALAATPFRLVRGQFGDQATVIGAGLLLVNGFLTA